MTVLIYDANILQMVIAKEVKPIYRIFSDKWQGALSANHLLIMNLAVADLLMGVYLVMLGVGELKISGKFCQLKASWCSSTLCSTMGTLVLLSSETSVLIMVLLTSLRLFSVFNVSNFFTFSIFIFPTRRKASVC